MERDEIHRPNHIQGEFIVAVGSAVVTEVSPDEAPGVDEDEQRAFCLMYVSPVMSHTVEYVSLGESEVNGAKRMMYMMQRSSSGEQRDALPDSWAEPYDALCYLDDWLTAEDDPMWEEELEERRSSDRYETEPPEWVRDALDT